MDPRVPSRDACVLYDVLHRRAQEAPDEIFALFEEDPPWTNASMLADVRRTAAALQALGVAQGDTVVCWLPNGPHMVRFWFALNYLGAVYVPINTAYRGGLLSHVLVNSGAAIAVVHAELLPRLAEIEERGAVRTVITVGAVQEPVAGLEHLDAATLPGPDAPEPPPRPTEPWDTQAILYTSGTTGPSKGVLSSYAQARAMFGHPEMPGMGPTERYMINMPMFHVGGATLLYAMLINGGSVAVVSHFSGERFWSQIRDTQSTVVFLLGVMGNFVASRPPAPDDADNPLKTAYIVPLIDDVEGFRTRFGCDVYTIFNMTELGAPILSDVNPTLRGTCGRVRPGHEIRLVDANDCEVPVGEVGEIIVRTDGPWMMNHGYNANAEATAAAWRNGWFHTGDAARRDADGNYFFVDRLKDAIRRRGENISSMEVEVEIAAFPGVREVAVIAVPSEISEDEVLAAVAPVPGATIDPLELIEFLRPRMAYYMVPRYIRILDELPKTPTSKVRKTLLREEAITAETWDREAAGIILRGERLSQGTSDHQPVKG
ncbi:AMP-binding protein [Baekduia soli]|nr:AMP-binding protein [Baekduia soli]